jgi:LysM repeat protein
MPLKNNVSLRATCHDTHHLSPAHHRFSFAAMKFSVRWFRCALAVLLCASLIGCEPPAQSQQDEEKEPHFIDGMRALNTYDYGGAVDEFEKAVEANPHNASAHFELGCLYEGNRQGAEQDPKEQDSAAAIYHYERFLILRPNAPNADFVKQRIVNCKQDLAKAVLPLPTTPGVQRDLEQLVEENKQLRAQLEQWQAYVKTLTNQPVALQDHPRSTMSDPQRPPAVVTATNPAPYTFHNDTHPTSRQPATHVSVTYVVQSRDTMASISRKFNVKLDSLTLANPGINVRRLRVGQTVNIP